MKKNILLLGVAIAFMLFAIPARSQNYHTDKLKMIADIWGEVYLFHPSIVRADKNISWEQELITFLPSIKGEITEDEFAKRVNEKLLSVLDDRFTRLQKKTEKISYSSEALHPGKDFDYIRFDESLLSDIGSLAVMDSIINGHDSQKPLLIDVRISKTPEADFHTHTCFDYFVAMFLTEPLTLSQRVSREHFGWDEWNDWWYYEQRWKINDPDRQIADCNILKPLASYAQELRQYLPEYDFTDFVPVKRPLYFITNNSFLSYYGNLLDNLAAQKTGVFILNENSGTIFTPLHSGLINYSLSPSYDFVLNTSFYLTNGQFVRSSYRDYDTINNTVWTENLQINPSPKKPAGISLAISPVKYKSSSPQLSVEEKILGIIKIRAILKHFHRDKHLYAGYLDQAFDKYIKPALTTETDKAYYELIQEMLAPINDSHISIFHPSIIDFSAMFVAPVNFEWIDSNMVITEVREDIAGCRVGDIISAIDNLPVTQILEINGKQISHSNRQGLLAAVINPGNFVGPQGSALTVKINGKDIVLSRAFPLWELLSPSENKESRICEGNIGYLNLALPYDTPALKNELNKMRNTRGLIIDLRNSYPTDDFSEFLSMLCPYAVTTRIAEVPIVSAGKEEVIAISKNNCLPHPDFVYKEKIAVLIDKTMVSRPEDIAIALSSFPHVVFIGEQTQGTDGEISKIHLPGNGEIAFTGQRIKFGNGKDFQGTGILPDIPVKKTVQGVKNNRDEILECALEYMAKRP